MPSWLILKGPVGQKPGIDHLRLTAASSFETHFHQEGPTRFSIAFYSTLSQRDVNRTDNDYRTLEMALALLPVTRPPEPPDHVLSDLPFAPFAPNRWPPTHEVLCSKM